MPGNPIPWERARSNQGRRFTAPRTREFQDRVRDAAERAGARPWLGDVAAVFRFYRATAQVCDADNLGKSVSDALNRLAYDDDHQICRIFVSKDVDRDRPRTEVLLIEIRPPTAATLKRIAKRKTAKRRTPTGHHGGVSFMMPTTTPDGPTVPGAATLPGDAVVTRKKKRRSVSAPDLFDRLRPNVRRP